MSTLMSTLLISFLVLSIGIGTILLIAMSAIIYTRFKNHKFWWKRKYVTNSGKTKNGLFAESLINPEMTKFFICLVAIQNVLFFAYKIAGETSIWWGFCLLVTIPACMFIYVWGTKVLAFIFRHIIILLMYILGCLIFAGRVFGEICIVIWNYMLKL